MRPGLRSRLNRWNGSTAIGLLAVRLLGLRTSPGPAGVRVAGNYRLPVPAATAFVVGDVIFCRRPAGWLLALPQRTLLRHEITHCYQYAAFGPLFWPLYFGACAWSYALTGDAAARNPFERRAGLDGGGYRDLPLRWKRISTRRPPSPAGRSSASPPRLAESVARAGPPPRLAPYASRSQAKHDHAEGADRAR